MVCTGWLCSVRGRGLRTIDPQLARQVHFLHRVLGMPTDAVATQLGVTEAAVVRALSG